MKLLKTIIQLCLLLSIPFKFMKNTLVARFDITSEYVTFFMLDTTFRSLWFGRDFMVMVDS